MVRHTDPSDNAPSLHDEHTDANVRPAGFDEFMAEMLAGEAEITEAEIEAMHAEDCRRNEEAARPRTAVDDLLAGWLVGYKLAHGIDPNAA